MKEGTKELFERLYKENEIIEHKARSEKMAVIFILMIANIAFFIMGLLYKPMFIVVGILFIICICEAIKVIKSNTKIRKKSEDIYKENIITPVLKYNFEDIKYNSNEGITLEEYKKAEYIDKNIERLDRFFSNDHIVIPLQKDDKKIDIYDVDIKRTYVERNRIKTETIYQGFTGMVELSKNIGTKIKLQNDYDIFNTEIDKKNKVVIDDSEFEEYFDITASDKILAMRIFTLDIMQEMINKIKGTGYYFDMNIINDKLYLRIYGNRLLEAGNLDETNEYDRIKYGIEAIELMQKLMCFVYELLEDIDI